MISRKTVEVGFDSTGLAIEDVAVAHLVYRKAKERGGYPSLEIV
jgi:ornithine cyclodeaminase/alanine dehydrogenase-like protein (mu-crystallin family)